MVNPTHFGGILEDVFEPSVSKHDSSMPHMTLELMETSGEII